MVEISQSEFLLKVFFMQCLFYKFQGSQSPQLCILQNRSLYIADCAGTTSIVPLGVIYKDAFATEHGVIFSVNVTHVSEKSRNL